MNPPANGSGRHALSARFTARVRIAALAYPSADQLQAIYTTMIKQVRRSDSGVLSGSLPAYLRF